MMCVVWKFIDKKTDNVKEEGEYYNEKNKDCMYIGSGNG